MPKKEPFFSKNEIKAIKKALNPSPPYKSILHAVTQMRNKKEQAALLKLWKQAENKGIHPSIDDPNTGEVVDYFLALQKYIKHLQKGIEVYEETIQNGITALGGDIIEWPDWED